MGVNTLGRLQWSSDEVEFISILVMACNQAISHLTSAQYWLMEQSFRLRRRSTQANVELTGGVHTIQVAERQSREVMRRFHRRSSLAHVQLELELNRGVLRCGSCSDSHVNRSKGRRLS